jgi:anti-sigma factor RsiW
MSAPGEMTCKEIVEVITDYLEGRLPPEDRERFEAHVEGCSYCANYLDQMRETIATLGTLRTESLSRETRDGLLEAFRGWRGVA